MRRAKVHFGGIHWADFCKWAAAAAILEAGLATCAMAQQRGQKTFASADEASKALMTAAQGNDEKAMLAILGPDGEEIVSSGDETEDAENRANFARRYQEMPGLGKEAASR